MNKWNFTGNLGKDHEMRYSQNAVAVCSFPVAVTSGYGDKKKTTWVNCALIGKRAEGKLPFYLVKGQQVAITGEVTLDEWTAKDGTSGKTLNVTVDSLDLIGTIKNGETDQSRQQQGGAKPQPTPQQAAQHMPQQNDPYQTPGYASSPQNQQSAGNFDKFEDDIPF